MGYIASQGEMNREVLKRALFYGGVMGSFAVERFGTERLQIADPWRDRRTLPGVPRTDPPRMNLQSNRRWDHETVWVVVLATCASLTAFLIYFRNGEILLFGDAVAHINIARRVFDSRTPGLLQLGTVWLPLPHV